MRERPSEKQVSWAHSVMNDNGATRRMKLAAKAVIAWDETNPDEEPDYLDDGIPDDDY